MTRPSQPVLDPFAMGKPWHLGTLVGFDLETTGIDTNSARVVTAAVVHVDCRGGILAESRNWLVDPGIDIPLEASRIHGVSTERARMDGVSALAGIAEILDELERALDAQRPLVVFNATYDLSLIDTEARRHGLTPLTRRPCWPTAVVVDPLVIDRGVDRYRKGSRTLQAAAVHYRVTALDAHSALGDAVAACQLARAIARGFPMVGRSDGMRLHRAQRDWHSTWAISFQAWRRAQGDADAVIDREWPLRFAQLSRSAGSAPRVGTAA